MPQFHPQASIRRHLIASTCLVALLFGGVGSWAATVRFAGAVIAPAILVVDTDRKKVQHPTGGVVGELQVQDGDHVKAGGILVKLDATVTRANLETVRQSLLEFTAQQARMTAESLDWPEIRFPPSLVDYLDDSDVKRVVDGETRLFHLRAQSRAGQKAQLRQKSEQLDQEALGLVKQIASKEGELPFLDKELAGVRELFSRQIAPITKLVSLERDRLRTVGEIGQLQSQLAQSKTKKIEIDLQFLQVDEDMRSDVTKQLRDVEAKISEAKQKQVAAADQLARIDIRAPIDGVVHELKVHTIGGVIQAGETIMEIVPTEDVLAVEAKIQSQDIEQVQNASTAILHFSAFNARTTPEIAGEVARISPDIVVDQKTGGSYYTVRVTISAAEKAKLGDVKLVPGMPVEAFIQTKERTVISYLTKPLVDQIAKAWREQ